MIAIHDKRWVLRGRQTAGAALPTCAYLIDQPSMRIFLHRAAFDPRYQKLSLYSAFLLYAVTILIGSIPGARSEVGEYASGWVLHSLLYAVLTLLLFRGYYDKPFRTAARTFLTICVMGALDEYIQSFFPYRSGTPTDWLVDVNAAFLTSALLYFTWPRYALSARKV
jgi:VanZ family protein